jgi:hypothetical protein
MFYLAVGPTQPSVECVLTVERPKLEAAHSPASSAQEERVVLHLHS